jgi:hypothetical protein
MGKLLRSGAPLALALSIALLAAPAQAQTSTRTFPGLTWNFTTTMTGFTGCSQLVLDATGGTSTGQYLLAGYLDCPAAGGAYLSDGIGYFDTTGRFNIQTEIGVAFKLLCTSLTGFSGTCAIYANSGTQTGSATISLR